MIQQQLKIVPVVFGVVPIITSKSSTTAKFLLPFPLFYASFQSVQLVFTLVLALSMFAQATVLVNLIHNNLPVIGAENSFVNASVRSIL